ncbi:MAG: hypothetical protein ABIX28_00550 [Vicinamibacterales bacterium]
MSVKVLIPRHLTRFMGDRSEVEVEATDLRSALEILSREYALEDILLNPKGHLQSFIRIVIDNDLIASRSAEDMSRVAVGGKTIEITSGFAGG